MRKIILKITAIVAIAFFVSFTAAKAVSILTVQQGGSGVGTITGIIKGSGTSPFSVATPGTDYTMPGIITAAASGLTMNTNRLLGRTTPGTGTIENITVGTGLSLSAGNLSSTVTGTVTSASVVTANGFAGSVATATSTPAITLSTTITGVLKGNGTAISAAASGTDYAPATSGTAILKGNGAGGFSNAAAGTDYEVPLTFSSGLTRTVTTVKNDLNTGVAGGQTATGGTSNANNLTLSSTSAATKGTIKMGTSSYDEAQNFFGVNIAPTARLAVNESTLGNDVARLTSVATSDDPTETVVQDRAATTDATLTVLHTFTVPTDTVYMVVANITARRTGGASGTAGDAAGYVVVGTVSNTGGTVAAVGSITQLYVAESQAAWNATIGGLAGATFNVRVAGAIANNITWHMTARYYPISS